MIRTLPLIAMLLIMGIQSFCQDVILKKNDEIIKCKIVEIGLDEIKYTLPEISGDVTIVMDKDDISKVIFENGKEMEFKEAMSNPDNYKNNHKNALKIEFLSPLVGQTTFAWEHSLRPGRSIETTFGIAGLGLDTDKEAKGIYGKFG